jgi:hypothetical protein
MSRSALFVALFVLPLCGFGPKPATDVAQDLQDLRQMKAWRTSKTNLDAGPATTPDQVCGIDNPASYQSLRLDIQLAPDVSDAAATAQIGALDRQITSFLADRGWTPVSAGAAHGGIPDLTRCSGKQKAIAQIYKTTGRCTMNSPCNAYDGFTVVLYLPRNPKQKDGVTR